MNPYGSLSDDFGLYCYLNTEMPLPNTRETILHFYDAVQKSFPRMTNFYSRETGEFVLEEDKSEGNYRWVTMEQRRLCSGYVNPPALEEADLQHLRVLELAPYHLNLTSLDCEALDVLFAFDFVFNGNHDEVVAEALGLHTGLEGLLGIPHSRVINFEPSIMIALDDSLRLQCRLNVETRTNAYQVRTGDFHDEPISVYFTVRQYRAGLPLKDLTDSYRKQRETCQELVDQYVIPSIIRPLAQVISAK